jgi:hypothetical protein
MTTVGSANAAARGPRRITSRITGRPGWQHRRQRRRCGVTPCPMPGLDHEEAR